MYCFTEHIVNHLLNEYGGSEKKRTVLLDDGNKYLLKFPDPVRDAGLKISYVNNAVSEYLGCKIAKSLGLPVQEVILGTYTDEMTGKTKIACACKDLREPGEVMHEINRLELESLDTSAKNTFREIHRIINRLDGLDKRAAEDFFYDMFILDALIGNTDRHNGNWAVLSDQKGNIRLCPIYDCGSCLSPLVAEEDLRDVNISNLALCVHSAIIDENGNRISYSDFLINGENPMVRDALLRIFPRINLCEISNIIDNTDGISDTRKNFYKQLITTRYEKIFIPALEKITLSQVKKVSDAQEEAYSFFRQYIYPLQKLPPFQKQEITIGDSTRRVMRISDKKALCFLDEQRYAILSLRNNNRDIESNQGILNYLGIPVEDLSRCKVRTEDEEYSR